MSTEEAAITRSVSRERVAWSFATGAQWVWRGAWAVLDQGLFALSNFGLNILLARWLTPQEYGAFTLAFSIFLVLGTTHTALLTEPMMVFGSARYRDRLPSYLAVVMRGHWLVTMCATVSLAAVGVGLNLLGERLVSQALLALAVGSPFILLLWLMRRRCYVEVAPHLAASGGLLYMVLLMAGAYLMLRVGSLTSPTALLLMGIGSVVSASWIKSRLPSGSLDRSRGFRRDVVAQHWAYGRWAVGTGVLGGLVLNMYYMVMPAGHGLESAATLKALTNLVMPATQSFWALSVVTLPALVRARETPAFAVAVRRLVIVYGALALAYWLALGLAHRQVVEWLYGGQYAGESHLLWFLGSLPIASAGISLLESALRARERSDEIFRAFALAAGSTRILGVPFTLIWGTSGAIAGLLVSCWLAVGSMAWSLSAMPYRPSENL